MKKKTATPTPAAADAVVATETPTPKKARRTVVAAGGIRAGRTAAASLVVGPPTSAATVIALAADAVPATQPNAGQPVQVAPCEAGSGPCLYKAGECILPCSSCSGAVVTPATVVDELKAQQADTRRMVGVIGHGSIGAKVVTYLQARGVAAIALGATPPAHLSVDKLLPAQLGILATEIPGGAEELLQNARGVAAATSGMLAARAELTARNRQHPAQLKYDAKKARKAEAKRVQAERTAAGQRRAKEALQQQPWCARAKDVLHGLAEAGIVIPPTVVGAKAATV